MIYYHWWFSIYSTPYFFHIFFHSSFHTVKHNSKRHCFIISNVADIFPFFSVKSFMYLENVCWNVYKINLFVSSCLSNLTERSKYAYIFHFVHTVYLNYYTTLPPSVLLFKTPLQVSLEMYMSDLFFKSLLIFLT